MVVNVSRTTAAIAAVLMVSACTHENASLAPPTGIGTQPQAVSAAGFADLAERLAPSVVTIQTADGLGSGVVLRADVVVTNAHVMGRSQNVTISYADGTRSKGSVLSTDAVTDVAVVRTERKNLPVPQFRKQLPRPGDVAVAIGSPLGFQNSVTAGIISGLHRDIPGSAAQSHSLVDLIQTDAPISPGNSGGALFDAQGRMVGLNEAYLPPQTGAVSLGFAIPTATVLDVAGQLLDHGSAIHPYLGVSLGQVTPSIQQQLGVHVDHGAVVLDVDHSGPAGQAGIHPGDVITRIADTDVRSVEDVLAALRRTEPGRQVQVSVVRGADDRQIPVVIGSRTG